MTLISANNISKSFGSEDIFENITVSVPPKSRIGFIGENGCGKTTFLKILLGLDDPDSGTVTYAKGLQIGYLPQVIEFDSDKSTYDLCMVSFADLIAKEKTLASLSQKIADQPGNEDLIAEYGRLEENFDHAGGYTYKNKINQVLQGLSLINGEEHRPWRQLSGGQKIRAYLAKVICASPDVLVLDEPTNHLDIQAIEWLESYLKEFTGAVVMVSHDRYFLDKCVNTIWELDYDIEEYHGNYSSYLMQREERYKRRMDEYERQQAFIQKEEEYIRRNIAGQNTRQAQGRRKRLESLLRDSKIIKPTETRSMKLKINTSLRSGDLVLRTKDIQVGYHDDKKVLFEVPDLTLIRGECAAVIGPNGTGKSTFLKTILGKLESLSGETILGSNLKIGYFAQAHEDLNPEYDLMDEISSVSPGMLPAEIRNYLARFLFTEDDVFKKVKILSGGEKGRLALAILSLQGSNLLLLDEPMNHLDIDSQELLQSVLKSFEGTIILVSHDRYLIDAVATQIWEVKPVEHRLDIYQGTYSQYKEYLASQVQSAASKTEKKSGGDYFENRKLAQERKKLQTNLEKFEKMISVAETELAELSQKLESPSLSLVELNKTSLLYNKKQEELEALYESWSEADALLTESRKGNE